MNPELSIVMPVYNQAGRVVKMLDSIARQKGVSLEVIVIDDASTDKSIEVIESWALKNPEVTLRILRQPERRYALAARIRGIQTASAPDIMIVDADDRLLGTKRLARVLARKKEYGAELAHFRTQMTEPDGRLIGEVNFDNLLAVGLLDGDEYLQAFTDKSWPPRELWGKIYSRDLLERVLPLLGETKRYRLDTVLALLAMLAVKSYLGCEEFIYEYKISDSWPMLKFVQRMHDFPLNCASLLETGKISASVLHYAKEYIKNFLPAFMAWNAGKMCDEFEASVAGGNDPDELLALALEYIDQDQLLALTLFSARRNADKIHNCLDRILHEFG